MNENKLNNISAIGKNCVGCRSCEQSCPQKCIYIKENTEGFLYPVIDATLCLNCGLCLCKCPEFHERVPRIPLSYYGLKEKEKTDIKNSASGGASDLAAKAILDRNGVVYGAAYNKDMRVVHIEVFDDEGRKAIQSSKYVQSDINNCAE